MMAGTLLAMAVVVAGVLNAHAGRGQNHGYDKAPASHGHGLHGDLSDDSIGKAQATDVPPVGTNVPNLSTEAAAPAVPVASAGQEVIE
jgi:hypothetical protein